MQKARMKIFSVCTLEANEIIYLFLGTLEKLAGVPGYGAGAGTALPSKVDAKKPSNATLGVFCCFSCAAATSFEPPRHFCLAK